jgi:modulator of FtsH protease
MSQSLSYGGFGAAATPDRTRTLFGQTMGYVAVTADLFALGAYLGRNLSHGVAIVSFIAAFAGLFIMRFTVRRAESVAVALLCGVGVLLGLAMAPTLVYYASTNPQVL